MKMISFQLGLIICLSLSSCGSPPTISTLPIGNIYTKTEVTTSPQTVESPTTSLISTPYITIFNGYFNCRADANMSSRVLILIQGQEVTIMAQNQGWLYVSVKDFNEPCWVLMEVIPNLDQYAISFIPYIDTPLNPTYTLPPGPFIPFPQNTSDSQHQNTSAPQPQNTSAPQPQNTSVPQPQNTSAPTETICLNPQGHKIPCH